MKRSRRGDYIPDIYKNILQEELRLLRKRYTELANKYSQIMKNDKTYQKTKQFEKIYGKN
jgi:hypothetical protein